MSNTVRNAAALAANLKAAADQAGRAAAETRGVGAAQQQLSPPLAIQETALAQQRAERAAAFMLRNLGLA